ncbi:MAG: gamma-glutamylcyclotransferase family protein [Isosphaeraceae bacterium]
MIDGLFVYGTLAPANLESAERLGFVPDQVRGWLYDLGSYPALVPAEEPSGLWVCGYVRAVPETLLSDRLDEYEGVAEGLYRREVWTTRAGRRVWVYVYARPIPANAVGPIDRWDGPRVPGLLDGTP